MGSPIPSQASGYDEGVSKETLNPASRAMEPTLGWFWIVGFWLERLKKCQKNAGKKRINSHFVALPGHHSHSLLLVPGRSAGYGTFGSSWHPQGR